MLPVNPQACWDWWSYISHADDYVTKSGLQIKTIKAMLDALTSGVSGNDKGDRKPAPATTSSVSPTTPAAIGDRHLRQRRRSCPRSPQGAATYRISRAGADGPFTVIAETTGPSYADSGLAPQTTYRWRVAVITNGVEGPASADVTATTRATPPACDTPGQCPLTAAK